MAVGLLLGVGVACGDGGARRPDSGAVRAGPAATPETRTVPADARSVVLFIGTSLTAGLGLDPGDAYPALIQRRIDADSLPFTVVNSGVSGETTAALLSRLDWILREPAAVIVLETGANDGLRGIAPSSVRMNLDTLITRIRAKQPAAKLVLVQMEAMPNLGARYTTDFHNAYVGAAKAHGVTLMPFLLDGVAGKADLNQGDGVHPNVEGERIVAENVWRALRPVLVETARR
jgi:acyl-CoA thioesterase-1